MFVRGYPREPPRAHQRAPAREMLHSSLNTAGPYVRKGLRLIFSKKKIYKKSRAQSPIAYLLWVFSLMFLKEQNQKSYMHMGTYYTVETTAEAFLELRGDTHLPPVRTARGSDSSGRHAWPGPLWWGASPSPLSTAV